MKSPLKQHHFIIDTVSTVAANLSMDNTSCSANSFMLRDSVCDEATNIETCLYDGGDCCLEAKVTKLCKNCSCILSVNRDDLQLEFSSLTIRPLEKTINFSTVIGDWTVEVTDVVSGPVCAILCLSHEANDRINAWHYDGQSLVCTCGWVESAICPEDKIVMPDNGNQTTLIDYDAIVMTRELHAFVQLGKTVPCGILTSNNCYYVKFFCSLFLKAAWLLRPGSTVKELRMTGKRWCSPTPRWKPGLPGTARKSAGPIKNVGGSRGK